MNKSFSTINYLLILITAILIQGCGGSSKQEELDIPQSIPDWYLNSPDNNLINLYGIGEGDTLKEAKANALNDMSSRLLVRVESSLETKKSSTTDSYQKEVNQDIRVDIEKMQYTNVKIEKNALIDYKYYILAKVSRYKQFEEKKKEFDILDKKITNKYKSIKKKNIYQKIIILENMKEDILKNRKKAFILYAINNDFDYGKYFKKYDHYIDLIQIYKNKLKITINSNEHYNYFKNTLIDIMNENKYTISANQPDVKINIKNKKRYSRARSWTIAKVSTTITVINNNRIVSSKTINTIGRSTSSKENAIQDASLEFSEIVNKKGVNQLLFNN